MKLLLSVIALAFATPALAQNAPADQHAGHANHAAQHASPAPATQVAPVTCTAEHAAMGHCKPGQGGPAAPADRSAAQGHDADCCKKDASGKMACCEKARAAGKDCCDEAGGAPQGTHAGHAGH